MAKATIKINRAPVLTLWGAVECPSGAQQDRSEDQTD